MILDTCHIGFMMVNEVNDMMTRVIHAMNGGYEWSMTSVAKNTRTVKSN